MNKIDESAIVYLNGQYGPNKLDNLKAITDQLNNGKRQPNQIYAMLCAMGIPEDKAKNAVDLYVAQQSSDEAPVPSIDPPLTKIQNETKNNHKMMTTYNLQVLIENLNNLKERLDIFRSADKSRINYSADKAFSITEAYYNKMLSIKHDMNALSQAGDDIKLVEHLNTKLKSAGATSKPEFIYMFKAMNELSTFKHLDPVATFIAEANDIVEANKYTISVLNVMNELNSARNSAFYKEAITDLKYLSEKSEQDVKESLTIVLEKYNWIPSISRIISNYKEDVAIADSTNEGAVYKAYSPYQVNEDGSVYFALNNKFYVISENKVSELTDMSKINGTFVNTYNALKDYRIVGESYTLYKGQNWLEYNTGKNEVKVNNVVVEHKNGPKFRNYLIQSNFFTLNELNKVDELMQLMESIDDVKELDFVTCIKSKVNEGVFVNLIRLEENLYVNKINAYMGVNELVEATSAEHAQSLVNEMINYDISRKVSDLLEGEAKVKTELDEQREAIVKEINFLNEKVATVKTAIKEIGEAPQLSEAIELLNTEIKNKEVELQKVYNKLIDVK